MLKFFGYTRRRTTYHRVPDPVKFTVREPLRLNEGVGEQIDRLEEFNLLRRYFDQRLDGITSLLLASQQHVVEPVEKKTFGYKEKSNKIQGELKRGSFIAYIISKS